MTIDGSMGPQVDTSPQPETPHWRRLHAFGLPEGSIRAILAVAIFATIWVLLVRHPHQEVPDYLRDLLFIIMGHYFASRRRSSTEPPNGPGPLFLPRGTIRLILFAGFVAVGVLLFRGGHFHNPTGNPGVVTLMLVAGFLLGVMVSKVGDLWRDRGHRVPRWIEDSRAAVALLATAVLMFLVWNRFDMIFVPRDPNLLSQWDVHLGSYGKEHILGAIVGFYFGSRS